MIAIILTLFIEVLERVQQKRPTKILCLKK